MDPVSAENALYAALFRLAELSPGMCAKTGAAGTRLLYSGLPIPMLNVVGPASEPDLGEVEAYASELSSKGLPWSIQLRDQPGPAMLELGARYGRTSRDTVPLLCRELGSLPPSPAPPHGTVRELPGSEHEVFAATLASGYPMPPEVAEVFARPALLDAPDMSAFVLEVEGEAVANGFNVLVGEWVGLFNGSVPPPHRRHGYYRALVAARLRHAAAAGARYAFSQNTPMSAPLYESLGFRSVAPLTYLT